jgi:hypothetical protein
MRRVLGVAVPEVVLHRTKIRTLIGQIVAARVPKDVGPDPSKPSFLPSQSHDVVDAWLVMSWLRSDTNSHGSLSSRWRRRA